MIVGVPKDVPAEPSSVIITAVKGTELRLYFSPGSGSIDILSYTIQWDTTPEFKRVQRVNGSYTANCTNSGYGSCDLTGVAITVTPPFQYLIQSLTPGVTYFAKVAARNALSASQAFAAIDVTRWSTTVSAVPNDRAPEAPVNVDAILSGKQAVQILITMPRSDGGRPVTQYLVEYDSSSGFDSTSYGKIPVPVSQLPSLYSNGPLVYEISGLDIGSSYYVRVSAQNSVGTGPYTTLATSITLAGKPLVPSAVSLSTASEQPIPITSINVSWVAPSGYMADGGSPISGYMIEWWEGTALAEVQTVSFVSTTKPHPTGSFNLKFQPSPGVGYSTASFPYNVGAFDVRSQLMNLGYDIGVTSFIVGDLRVSQAAIQGGYMWTVTFNTDTNKGDQVPLVGTPSDIADGTVVVTEVTPGRRPQGTPEIQLLQILTIGSSNVTHLGGYFRLSFNSTRNTHWLPVNCDEAVMKRGLEQLSSMRVMTISKQVVSSNGISVVPPPPGNTKYAGFQWSITFTGNVGNMPPITVENKVTTSDSKYVISLLDGDNSLDSNGMKKSWAYPGEMPAGYNLRTVDQDVRNFIIPGLVPGTTYYVAVSAVNAFGVGARAVPLPSFATPPKQIPQPPVNVSLTVNFGSAKTLKLSYLPPVSNGGVPVTKYRLEIDTTYNFKAPLVSTIPCPSANLHSVYQITTLSAIDKDPILSGFFSLRVRYIIYSLHLLKYLTALQCQPTHPPIPHSSSVSTA